MPVPLHAGQVPVPEHCLHLGSVSTAWRNVRATAGLPALRFHDLRHHAITELAESQASAALSWQLPDMFPRKCFSTTRT